MRRLLPLWAFLSACLAGFVAPALASDDGTWVSLPPVATELEVFDPVHDRWIAIPLGATIAPAPGERLAEQVLTLTVSGPGPRNWTRVPTVGTPPPRGYPTEGRALYDALRNRIIYFHVTDPFTPVVETWSLELDGIPTWVELPVPYTPGTLGSSIYDPVRDRIVSFVGDGAGDKVWALTFTPTPAWTDITPAVPGPGPRRESSVIHDPTGDRMIVFGGYQGLSTTLLGDVWALSLGGTPAWSDITPAGTSPGARRNAAAVADPARERMLVFGGSAGAAMSDVWAFDLGASPSWSQLVPTGDAPAGRIFPAAALDGAGDHLVILGNGVDSYLNANLDSYALPMTGPPTWTLIAPLGAPPTGRERPSAIFDPVGDRMVVFGGSRGSWKYNQAWSLGLEGEPSWSLLEPAGTKPQNRYGSGAAYDPVRHRMVIFGGRDSTGGAPADRNDVWALSLGADPEWTELLPSGTKPTARRSTGMIYDPVRDRVLVIGGVDEPSTDVWELSFSPALAWTRILPGGTLPPALYDHTAIYDPVGDRVIVFGGYETSSNDAQNTVWALDLSGAPAWSQLSPTGTPPSPRGLHTAIYDPVRHRMVVFSGELFTLNDTWSLDLGGGTSWTRLSPGGVLPEVKGLHVAVYDDAHDQMVIWGGAPNQPYASALVWGTVSSADRPAPGSRLGSAHPNPSFAEARLQIELAVPSRVRVEIHDASGRLVRRLLDREFTAGRHAIAWDGADDGGHAVPAGAYFARVSRDGATETRKLLRLR